MNILITGGTGYVGKNLIKRLIKTDRIYCIVRNKTKLLELRNLFPEGDIFFIEQDLRKNLNVSNLPEDIDTIIHLAMNSGDRDYKKADIFKINVLSTLELLEYGDTLGIGKFLYASTGGIYGYGENPFKESDGFVYTNFYSLTKWQSELLINEYSENFTTLVCRYFFPYGPNQNKRIIGKLIYNIKNNYPIILKNGGGPKINPIFIDDAIEYTARILEQNSSNIYNIAGDEIISIFELSQIIGKKLNIEPRYKYVFENTGNLIGDISKIRAKIKDYSQKIYLEEGIGNII